MAIDPAVLAGAVAFANSALAEPAGAPGYSPSGEPVNPVLPSYAAEIEKALFAGLLECLPLPISQGNAVFDRPANYAPWAGVYVLANQPSPATLGVKGMDAHDGIMQVDLYYPRLRGTAEVSAMERVLSDFFHAGRVVVHGGTRVHISSCGGARNNPDRDGYYCRSLTIFWHARIDRPT